ncbi:MAG TPA: hypothetical protein VGB75_14130 [Jatrophihabitans sp.]|uniref:hypothetical protein n=1 Tax=Jatrophihabitans sp. TaxID=1932789 RepID=UPI002EEA587A
MSGRPSKLTLLHAKWLLLHAVTIAVCAGMIWLGLWQWRAAVRRGDDLRNYAYALQWWAFVGFTVLMWFRIVNDHLRPDRHAKARDARTPDGGAQGGGAQSGEAQSGEVQSGGAQDADGGAAGAQQPRAAEPATRYRAYTPPSLPSPELETDPERRRLNAYLARLSAADREAAE